MKRIRSRLAGLVALAWLFILPISLEAQNVSPLGATGFTQWFDNSGAPLVNGAIYFYAAGTTTQAPTYTAADGQTLNPNPLPLTTGGRVNAWLLTTQLYKIVLCQVATDGPFCSPGDVLAMADQVPGGSAGGGSGSCATGCVGFFVSGTASPATSGVLRCASGDQCVSFRNTAGSSNLALTKDSNDLFSIPTAWKLPAISAPSGVAGFGVWWFDNTANRLKMANNGGTAAQVVASGNDINTQDSVTAVHAGATQLPISSTAPTTNQQLCWNGTTIGGCGPIEGTMTGPINVGTNGPVCATATSNSECVFYTFGIAHTLTRLVVNTTVAPSGCSTNAVIGVKDITSSTVLLSQTPTTTGLVSTTGSVTIPAGDTIGVGLTTLPVGCTQQATIGSMTAVFQ